MITFTHVTCDACGKSVDMPDPTSPSQFPPGWLHGTLSLYDSDNKEGPFWGHACDDCTALPVRELIAKQAAYRAGKGAHLK